MHSFFVQQPIEDVIDGFGGPGRILGIAGDAGLVQLDRAGFNVLELPPQHDRYVHGQIREVPIEAVGQYPRQHVRTGAGKFQGQLG